MSWENISFWIEHHPGLASWVQALGSIAAIWGAFQISNMQVKKQSLHKEKDTRIQAWAYFAVAKSAVDNAISLFDSADEAISYGHFKLNWDLHHSHMIESSLASLKLIPPHALGSYDLVIAFNGLMANMSGILIDVKQGLDPEEIQSKQYMFFRGELSMRRFNIGSYWEKFGNAFLDKHDGVKPDDISMPVHK
ncbi:hypothetical protein [Pseudomonas sp. S2_E01]